MKDGKQTTKLKLHCVMLPGAKKGGFKFQNERSIYSLFCFITGGSSDCNTGLSDTNRFCGTSLNVYTDLTTSIPICRKLLKSFRNDLHMSPFSSYYFQSAMRHF